MADCLSLATCRLREHSIDLRLEVVGVLWGRGGGDKRVVSDYPIETLSTGFNLLSGLCVTACEKES